MMDDKEHYYHDFQNLPRLTILPWLVWAVLILAVISATSALAEEIPVHTFDQDGVSMKLLRSPCTDAVSTMMLAQGLPKYADRAKAITSVWRMKDGNTQPFAGCWLELSAEEAGATETVLILVFEDMQHFVVPKSEFVKKPGQSGA